MIPWHRYVDDFALLFLFLNYHNIRPSMFYFSICLYYKISQDFSFSASVLDDESTTSLRILYQISCTEASGPFFPLYCDIFYTDFLLSESKSKHMLHSTFSLHSLCRGINPGCQWHVILSSF